MFKQLTNVQAPKTDKPELGTTPTPGTMKLNDPACAAIKVGNGDFLSVLEDDDTNSEWNGLWLTKGNESTKDAEGKVLTAQFGSKVASITGKNGGSMQFSSEMAYRALKGNKTTREVYSIETTPMTHPDFQFPLYKLTWIRSEAKTEKKAKAVTA